MKITKMIHPIIKNMFIVGKCMFEDYLKLWGSSVQTMVQQSTAARSSLLV